jgi:hypothetical protein
MTPAVQIRIRQPMRRARAFNGKWSPLGHYLTAG